MYFKRIIVFILLAMALELYVVCEFLAWSDRAIIVLYSVQLGLALPGLLYGIYCFLTGH
ncbi:hypothetical protein [Simiduia agarivorans]|uniref:Uncharacterized protein n=1 Tax=Simiduia agarivorans (strain DSM 21679 / JCM 13881 / BCRC 17597 / SA1) TaxID=1117647 RepID=R9S4V5_SIMAS|nr:hypothetical protein [Simiduia agarivorans]AGN11265.1 hypothetical protein M5M_00897 [Simiduia agarivorans SA1 = DSM 21679]